MSPAGSSSRTRGFAAFWRRRDLLDGVACLAGAVWLSVAVFGRPIGDYGVETDFYADFVPHALEWMRGEPSVMNGFRGPLYYLVLGVSTLLFRDAFLAGKILSALSAAVGIRLLGGLVRGMFGRTVGLFAALFVVANAVFVELAIRASTDAFYWLLFVATLALLFPPKKDPLSDGAEARRRRDRRWLLAGLVAGAAFLTRYNGAVLLGAGLVVVLATEGARASRLRAAGLFLLGWLVLTGPWMAFLAQRTGDPLWNQAFQNVAVEVYVSHPVFAQNGDFKTAVGFESLLEVVRVDPSAFGGTLARNLVEHVWRDARDLVKLPWAMIAVVGLVALGGRWRGRAAMAFAGVGFLTYASTLAVFYGPRFMLPLLVWWSLGVGGFVDALVARGARWRTSTGRVFASRRRGISFAIVLALAAVTHVREIRAARDPLGGKGSPLELLDLARKVERVGAPLDASTPIAARKPHLGYYLDVPVVPLAGSTVTALRERGARYLLVTAQEIRVWPALAELLQNPDSRAFAGSLRPVARTTRRTASGETSAALFEVVDPRVYEPPTPSIPRRERATVAGLNRLDTLRLRLARWLHKWDGSQPTAPLFARMSESARSHPDVLQTRGDAAMRARDLVAAEDFYREAATYLPQDVAASLRWAGVLGMLGKQEEFDGVIDHVASLRSLDTTTDPELWWDLGTEVLNQREFTQAIAPLAQCARVASPGSPCSKLLGKTFIALQWYPEARNVLEIYRKENPTDPETPRLLRRLAEQAGA